MFGRPPTLHLMRISPLLLGLLMVLSILLAHPAQAQTPTEKIREFSLSASGFALRDDVEEGSLPAGRQMSFPLELLAGVDYMVVGFCDAECTDLDLAILDPSGVEIETDFLPDAQPILIVTPEREGRYEVRVDMVECGGGPCLYAVGVLEGDLGEEFGMMGETMEDRFALFRGDLTEEGYAEFGLPETGTLDEGQEIRFSVSLVEGLEFEFVGVCDNDCENLDLVLYDPQGEEVASDLLDDAFPLVAVTPAATGEYRMAARMTICTIEPCAFMVGGFVKGEGIGPGGVPLTGNIVMERTTEGTLEEGDERLKEGEYFDQHTFEAQAGQTIIVDLRSPDFDTFLILESPGGDQERNDDWGDDTMHSHIEMVAPESGTYSVLVTTFIADEVGEYVLQIAVVEGG